MTCSVRYSPEARDDLIGILDYIGVELTNPQAAARIVRAIAEKIDLLSEHPFFDSSVRQFPVGADRRAARLGAAHPRRQPP